MRQDKSSNYSSELQSKQCRCSNSKSSGFGMILGIGLIIGFGMMMCRGMMRQMMGSVGSGSKNPETMMLKMMGMCSARFPADNKSDVMVTQLKKENADERQRIANYSKR